MSETPRNDDEQGFRDPTAPSYDAPAEDPGLEDEPPGNTAHDAGSTWSGSSPTEQVPTGSTQQVPSPPAGDVPPPPQPQNPYAAPPAPGAPGGSATGQDPYARPPYPTQGQVQPGQPGGYGPPPPGYGANPYAPARRTNGSAIALTIVSGALLLVTCGGALLGSIPGLVLGIIGISKANDDPAGSARLTKIGWIVLAAGVVLSILALIGLFVVARSSGGGDGFTTGY